MDAETFKTLAIAAPWGVIIVVLRYMDIKYEIEKQKERDRNALEKSQADRESQQYIAKAYAEAINALARSIADQTSRTEIAIKEFKETVLEQYKNMGITQDLLDMAKVLLAKQGEAK